MARRVFVVDDEQMIADSLAAILKFQGYDATAFYGAEPALTACDIAAPECILTDVMMPGIGGVELAIAIRSRFPACRILLFSGSSASLELLDSARREGYEFELLLKPVHPKDLLERLKLPATLRTPANDVPCSPQWQPV